MGRRYALLLEQPHIAQDTRHRPMDGISDHRRSPHELDLLADPVHLPVFVLVQVRAEKQTIIFEKRMNCRKNFEFFKE